MSGTKHRTAGSEQHVDGTAWKIHEIRMPGEFVAGVGYSNSFANFAHDMNGDGLQDAVIIGFPGDPYHWYQNPGVGEETHWKEHVIWSSACNESPEFEDLNGDGIREIIIGSQPEAQMGFNVIPAADKSGETICISCGQSTRRTRMKTARSSITTAWVPVT